MQQWELLRCWKDCYSTSPCKYLSFMDFVTRCTSTNHPSVVTGTSSDISNFRWRTFADIPHISLNSLWYDHAYTVSWIFLLYISSILCKDSKGTSLTFQISVLFKSHTDIGTIMKACCHIETLVPAVAEMFFACHQMGEGQICFIVLPVTTAWKKPCIVVTFDPCSLSFDSTFKRDKKGRSVRARARQRYVAHLCLFAEGTPRFCHKT